MIIKTENLTEQQVSKFLKEVGVSGEILSFRHISPDMLTVATTVCGDEFCSALKRNYYLFENDKANQKLFVGQMGADGEFSDISSMANDWFNHQFENGAQPEV